MTIKMVALVSGAITSTAGALILIWSALDYTGVRPVVVSELVEIEQQVAANTKDRYYRRYQELDRKRLHGGLTLQEKSEFCWLAKQLGWKGNGC